MIGIVNATLCDNSTTPISCEAPQYGVQFATGTIVPTWTMDPTTGNSTLSMYKYVGVLFRPSSSLCIMVIVFPYDSRSRCLIPFLVM